MKKRIYTRPVSVVLTDEIFNSIKEITDQRNIGISAYMRDAIQERLSKESSKIVGMNHED